MNANEKNICKPLIGLVGRPSTDNEGGPLVCCWDNVRRAVIASGGIPIVILPQQDTQYVNTATKDIPSMSPEEQADMLRVVSMCDALIFQGGYRWFAYEKLLAQYAIDNDLVTLGICMGMQMLNNVGCKEEGVTNALNDTDIDHKQPGAKYCHEVTITAGTRLFDIIGASNIRVNSKHSYHICKTGAFIPCAYSPDGIIEGIEMPSKRFMLAVQWHPEAIFHDDEPSKRIFDSFIEAASIRLL